MLPILNSFDGTNSLSIVIMDNGSIRHVVDAIENTAQARVIFLSSYSPD